MIPSGSVWCGNLGLILIISIAISSENYTFAQIAPDTTLGSESSEIVPLNPSTDQIDGGAIRGTNLFHSFEEFNVDAGRGIYFSNPAGIENILSRVTGKNPSKIFGKLGVLGGNANLFLINPTGIIFGADASLNVGGSFIATTANAIGFGNQGFFSASAPDVPPVLTINPSALLFNSFVAGEITNSSINSAGQRLNPFPFAPSAVKNLIGLQVPNGKSLLLVGGNLNLNGGGLNALGGRVELGAVANSGAVGLNVNGDNLSLSFPDNIALADISFSNRARVDTSGEGSGNIQVRGKRITLNRGSQIAADTLGSKSGGTLSVTASDSLNLTGVTIDGTLSSRTAAAGDAGNITINTKKLIVQGGAQITTYTSGNGSGGKLSVNATESVELIGTSPGRTPSSLFSATTATGNAGDLTINTSKLIVQDGAQISTDSSYVEDAFGNFILATGRGGDLIVNATDLVELTGTSRSGLSSQLSASTQGTGNGGNIKIATNSLIIRDKAQATVSSQGTGNAGNLEVQAKSIGLQNGSKLLSTNTLGKGGGNITLKDLDLLLLRDNGEISTNAGDVGNGGNINIETDILAATDKSNITAKAVRGSGGNIQIATQGLFVSANSSINADSEQGINGVVEINRPDVDPSAELIILPAQIVDISKLIAQGCSTSPANLARGTGEFVMTGRGGLPPNPAEATRSDTVIVDLGTFIQSDKNLASAAIANNNSISSNTNAESTTLVEASSWVIGSKGEVILTANTPTFTSDIPWLKPTSCNGS